MLSPVLFRRLFHKICCLLRQYFESCFAANAVSTKTFPIFPQEESGKNTYARWLDHPAFETENEEPCGLCRRVLHCRL